MWTVNIAEAKELRDQALGKFEASTSVKDRRILLAIIQEADKILAEKEMQSHCGTDPWIESNSELF